VLPFLHLIFAWVVQPERIYLPPDSNFTAKFSFRGYFKQMFSLLTSLKFWLFVIWGSVGLTSSYFYMSTLHSQLLWRFDDKNFADSATVWFSTLLFFAGLFSVPITGWIYKKSLTLGFFVITISNITYIILSLIQVATLQYFTFVLFIFSRTAFFGMWSHYTNIYYTNTQASAVGVVATIAGITNFSNYFWNYLVIHFFGNSFFYMSISMGLVFYVVSFILTCVVFFSMENK